MRYASWHEPEDGWHDMESEVRAIPIATFADLAGRKDSDSHYADVQRREKRQAKAKRKKRK